MNEYLGFVLFFLGFLIVGVLNFGYLEGWFSKSNKVRKQKIEKNKKETKKYIDSL